MFGIFSKRAYLTGGAVRDEIMGKEPHDFDYVVADTTEEEYENEFPDHNKVGKSFPVYIHAKTGDEIALARIEYSTGNKYQEFETRTGVTICSDLARRDFTICSIAKHYVTCEIIDPFNGIADIKHKLIRTINPNSFIEDPLRILRGLRFASAFDFTIEAKTFQMMKDSVHLLKTITPERIVLELEKMYKQSNKPSRFFELLNEIGGLDIHFSPLALLVDVYAGPSRTVHGDETAFEHVMDAGDRCKTKGYSFDIYLAAIFHDVGKYITSKSIEYKEGRHHYKHELFGLDVLNIYLPTMRFTAYQNKLITIVCKEHMIHSMEKMKPVKLVRFYKRIKSVYNDFIKACNCDCPLTLEHMKIFTNLEQTFKEAKIDIPKNILDKGGKVVVDYVENIYAKKYKEI